jgi:hypothetical protein
MGFFTRLLSGGKLDGEKLARSAEKSEYAQIALLGEFAEGRTLHSPSERQRWSRVLPKPYDDLVRDFSRQGWLEVADALYRATASAAPFIAIYRERLEREKAAVLPLARKALQERDAGEALSIRRAYEARQPLGKADWTGPEPQLSHSALTRRILFMDHWLLVELSQPTAEWLRIYAAEQHLWGATWRLSPSELPPHVAQEFASSQMDAVESAYWRAYQLSLYVDNQETWQRCKGGDHVRRIEIVGPDDEFTCALCKPLLGKQFLVARTPELPPRACTSLRGCLCRYEPVLESMDDRR